MDKGRVKTCIIIRKPFVEVGPVIALDAEKVVVACQQGLLHDFHVANPNCEHLLHMVRFISQYLHSAMKALRSRPASVNARDGQ